MALEAAVLQGLDRHQRRRGQGIPTVSVLAGPPGAGVALWARWLQQRNLPQISTRASTEAGAVQDWWEVLARGRRLSADAAAFLEVRAGLAPGELSSRLRGQTAYERQLLLQGLVPPASGGPLAACRCLLDPADAEPEFPALLTACGPDPGRVVEALLALLPPDTAPALLLLGSGAPWLARAARIAARLCAAAPRWVVALPVDRRELDAWLRGSESQALAMVREGVLEVDAAAPEALEQRLTALGVPATSTLTRSLARLAADGSSDELIALFGEAARPDEAAAVAGPRARSAAERFLFARLDSLPWSRGLFELNANPGFPFSDSGRPMEVDLLSRSLHLAIELDGYHHFQDSDAYRTDRRKDLELQRHGYLVVRFLSNDVVGHLEEILKTLSELVSLRTGPEGALAKGPADDGGA